MRIIGDVHGKHTEYLKVIRDVQYSVQVGDFGFNYNCLHSVDSNCHKIIGGNHDNYDVIGSCPNNLGDFGETTLDNINFFFVRGELSVDKQWRTEGVSWWRAEELTQDQMNAATKVYQDSKPSLMITHGCPEEALPFFLTNPSKAKPSNTTRFLQVLFEIHRPDMWIFGHHHKNETLQVGNCKFICLNELNFLDI